MSSTRLLGFPILDHFTTIGFFIKPEQEDALKDTMRKFISSNAIDQMIKALKKPKCPEFDEFTMSCSLATHCVGRNRVERIVVDTTNICGEGSWDGYVYWNAVHIHSLV